MTAPVERFIDRLHMLRAIELAARGWGRVQPNPMVGAVIVNEGEVVGEGWHTEYGLAHAEVEALRIAGERARGATMYVSLEPCSHQGKTPPCTDAILQAGVRRVVFACFDPNARARGGGESLMAAGVEVQGGLEEGSARDLNAAFLHAHSEAGAARPWIELKLALSLDARIADASGRSGWITGEEARREVHRLRAGHDAVMVGIGTALADDPLLTVRGDVTPRSPPVRVVLDRRLRLPVESRLVRSAAEVPVWVVCGAGAAPERRLALERAGVAVLEAEGVGEVAGRLREAGVGAVFCEGGAAVASSLLRDHLVDRLTLFYAPRMLGPSGISPFQGIADTAVTELASWRHLRTAVYGQDTLISLAR